jgi:hypothetical protein
VDPRAVLDAVVKRKITSPRRKSNSRIPVVQLVAQRYTDYSLPCSTEVKNEWTYASTPPVRLRGVVLELSQEQLYFRTAIAQSV